jgi:hypothetical protein
MLIGIDATRANKTAKTGVEWYAWHVIQELKKTNPWGWKFLDLVCKCNFNRRIRSLAGQLV